MLLSTNVVEHTEHWNELWLGRVSNKSLTKCSARELIRIDFFLEQSWALAPFNGMLVKGEKMLLAYLLCFKLMSAV